jgi:murein L,D-transpeptidase YafK
MSEANLTAHADAADAPFWRDLKSGSDLFEKSKVPPKVSVCNGRYRFEAGVPGSNGSTPIVDGCSSIPDTG